ncbi:hypothetical protein, partial [Variovorax sp. dw_954]|uniref:hypothetical protein n=1 Tax=Variovorax sp. dw_954 TaxID=2720078 RepID=UPI001BD41A34
AGDVTPMCHHAHRFHSLSATGAAGLLVLHPAGDGLRQLQRGGEQQALQTRKSCRPAAIEELREARDRVNFL